MASPFIGINHASQVVVSNDQLVRTTVSVLGNSTPASSSVEKSLLLQVQEDSPHSAWLLACAYCAHLESPLQNQTALEYFKTIAAHIPKTQRPNAALLFSHALAHAFVLFYGDQFRSDSQRLDQLHRLFLHKQIDRAINPLGAHAVHFSPIVNAQLRQKILHSHTQNILLPDPAIHPFLDWYSEYTFYTRPDSIFDTPPAYPLNHRQLPYAPIQTNDPALLSSCFDPFSLAISHNSDPTTRTPNVQLGQSIVPQTHCPYPSIDPLLSNIVTSVVESSLLEQQQAFFKQVREQIPQWQSFVCSAARIPQPFDKWNQALSVEQFDAIGLSLYAFSKGRNFILADETGLGKGRTLAALARTFLASGRKVFFISEKRTLFTDFWRDLCALYTTFDAQTPPTPFLLHAKGKVFDQQGHLIFKALPGNKFKEAIEQKKSDSPLVFTTYSQFNKTLKKHPRMLFAQHHLQDALLILDESHCAAGDSQTSQNIQKLVQKAQATIFSSATFSKSEEGLALYLSAFPVASKEFDLLLNILPPDSNQTLTKALTTALVRSGCMIRREHPPDFSISVCPFTLNEYEQSKTHQSQLLLSQILELCFELAQIIDASPFGSESKSSIWLRLGGLLARISRQHLLVSKLDATVRLVQQLVSQNKKPVIALQSTFESFLKWALNPNIDSIDELDAESDSDADQDAVTHFELQDLHFGHFVEQGIFQIIPPQITERLNHPKVTQLVEQLHQLCQQFPDWTISPIDYLIGQLQSHRLKVGEISGRNLKISNHPTAGISIDSFQSPPREHNIYQFNHGQLDVLILTQAGATGISIHSDASFSDTKQRAFVELEIASNAALRLQFLGRTRRKGQVSAPEHYLVLSNHPYEQRLLERALLKEQKIHHLNAQNTQHVRSLPIEAPRFSTFANKALIYWLASEPLLCKKMHLDCFAMLKQCELLINGPLDIFLRRMVLLSPQEQQKAMDFLFYLPQQNPITHNTLPARLIDRQFIWGPDRLPKYGDFEPFLFQDTYLKPPSGQNPTTAHLQQIINSTPDLRHEFQAQARLFENHYHHILRHPLIQYQWMNLKQSLDYLYPGGLCSFFHPHHQRQQYGLILNVIAPQNAAFWCFPSLWKVQIQLPASSDSTWTSLQELFEMPQIQFEHKPLKPSNFIWDQQGFVSQTQFVLSGHSVYTHWWLKHMSTDPLQYHTTLHTEHSPHHAALLMPPEHLFNPIAHPLLTVQLAIDLLFKDVNAALFNHYDPQYAQVKIKKHGSHWILTFSKQAHEQYVDYPLDRRLGHRKYLANEHIERTVLAKDLRYALFCLYQKGLCFFIPQTRFKWYFMSLNALF